MPLEKDRAADTVNMQRNLVKLGRVAPKICQQTDKKTHAHQKSFSS